MNNNKIQELITILRSEAKSNCAHDLSFSLGITFAINEIQNMFGYGDIDYGKKE